MAHDGGAHFVWRSGGAHLVREGGGADFVGVHCGAAAATVVPRCGADFVGVPRTARRLIYMLVRGRCGSSVEEPEVVSRITWSLPSYRSAA